MSVSMRRMKVVVGIYQHKDLLGIILPEDCILISKMTNSKKVLLIVIFAVLMLLAGFVLVVAAQQHWLQRVVDDVLYDNYNHYLPCEKLPDLAQVQEVLSEHGEVIEQLEQLRPGSVVIELADLADTCPGKADIVIYYPSHQIRLEIESVLGGKTFFGIPSRWRNW